MIAKELEVPVIALSQLSRQVTTRKGQRPVLSDLRESGAIEQDADIVMFIHRPDLAAEEKELADGKVKKNVAEIIFAKNRSGACETFELLFKGERSKFINMPAKYIEDIDVPPSKEERSARSKAKEEDEEEEDTPFDEPPFSDDDVPDFDESADDVF